VVVYLFVPSCLTAVGLLPLSVPSAVAGESKEIKGIGSTALLACLLLFKSAKADYACLLRM